jgi:hypothetical protein
LDFAKTLTPASIARTGSKDIKQMAKNFPSVVHTHNTIPADGTHQQTIGLHFHILLREWQWPWS